MKTALDVYARGKQREANADDYNSGRYYSRDRFFCPECGEPVHLIDGKYSNHFAHYKKSDMSIDCDRRVDGNPTDSIYVRVGLPIYLRKNPTDDFYLYLGFKALPSFIMDQAVEHHVSVKIDNKRIYRINSERFSTEKTTLIPLDYVPLHGRKFHISYEPSYEGKYLLLQHWSDYADGFSLEGALFSASEQGGRKIRYGDSISTDIQYYWVRKNSQLPYAIPGINMAVEGRLVLGNTIWTVFGGTFSSSISDKEFDTLTRYLRVNLHVHLLEKKPEFVPIWPPVIKTEEGYIVSDKDYSVYGYVSSGNDDPKVYAYHGISQIPCEIKSTNHVACVNVVGQEVYVNIDRKYVSNGTLLLKRSRVLEAHDMDIYECVDGCYVSLPKEGVRSCDKISLKNDYKTELIIIRKTGEIEKRVGVGEYIIDNLKNGESIYVLQNRCLIAILYISIEEEQKNLKINDDEMYRLFERFKGTKEVKLPNKLRIQIFEIRDNVVLSRKYLDDALKSNTISTAMIRKLGELISEYE